MATTTTARPTSSAEKRFHLLYAGAMLLSLFLNFMFLSKAASQMKPMHLEKFRYYFPKSTIPRQLDEAFSACMLVMDDNHRLTEWLAYHYHVLPLDYLVVAIDPNSKTSPSPILDQWRSYGMTIIEWNNTGIFKGKQWEYENIVLKRDRMPHDHRQRQNMFLRNCLMHMKTQNRTWVMLVDSDEYLLFNGAAKSKKNYAGIEYPSIKKESSILDFLNKERKREGSNLTEPCIAIPRMLFGAVESSEAERHKNVPWGLDPHVLDTVRYRKHIRRLVTHHHIINGWAKVIVDVSRTKWDDMPTSQEAFQTIPWVINVHEPLPKICPRPYVKDINTLLRINHYVGSWEAFSYRQDARASEGRDKSKWQTKADRADETDDNIRPWLEGFMEQHGTSMAAEMLSEAGVFAPKPEHVVVGFDKSLVVAKK
jgi:hypothetical protein